MTSSKELEKRIDKLFKQYFLSVAGSGGNPPSEVDKERDESAYYHFIDKVKHVISESKKLSRPIQNSINRYIETKYPFWDEIT